MPQHLMRSYLLINVKHYGFYYFKYKICNLKLLLIESCLKLNAFVQLNYRNEAILKPNIESSFWQRQYNCKIISSNVLVQIYKLVIRIKSVGMPTLYMCASIDICIWVWSCVNIWVYLYQFSHMHVHKYTCIHTQ